MLPIPPYHFTSFELQNVQEAVSHRCAGRYPGAGEEKRVPKSVLPFLPYIRKEIGIDVFQGGEYRVRQGFLFKVKAKANSLQFRERVGKGKGTGCFLSICHFHWAKNSKRFHGKCKRSTEGEGMVLAVLSGGRRA